MINAQAKEFDHLKGTLERLATAVLAQLGALERAAVARESNELRAIVERDKEIDTLELALDRLGRSFMELRAPLGPDFRFVMATLDIARNLERIGDCAEYVARHLLEAINMQDTFPEAHRILVTMINSCKDILAAATASWAKGDARLASRIPAQDDVVDALQKEMYQLMIQEVRAKRVDVELGMKAVLMANKLESIADIASHIAEAVVFVLQARQIRHEKGVSPLR